MAAPSDVIALDDVGLRAGGVEILTDVTWRVRSGESWAVLGANGSGKTSLLRLAAFERGPSQGTVTVLGREYGRCDVRAARRDVGFVSAATLDRFRPRLDARTIVMTAKHAALEPWWHEYDDQDRARADELLAFVGCAHVADRAIGECSEGERKRVLLARALMARPSLLLLDEPCAGLDLAGREALLAVIADLAADPSAPMIVLTTHHLEEIPASCTHALLLRSGRVVASGPVADTITSARISETFGVEVEVVAEARRFSARLVR